MNIAVIGTGYVGLPTGVCFAELGHNVICVDKDISKIEMLKKGKVTLFEEGLEELFGKNLSDGKIVFTTSTQEGVQNADIVIIAVGTPPHPITKEADMKYIHSAAIEVAEYLSDYTVVAVKSTVPVGTCDDIEMLMREKNDKVDFDVVSLPEFLREGFAVHDFFNPDRVVVGTDSKKAENVIRELYKDFNGKTELLFVKRRSSETIKYASNAFLSIKIHYINEMADFCEKTGADVIEVAKGMGLDSRIGNKFLNSGPGYGGSCFPKDTYAMAHMGHVNGVRLTLINAAIDGNTARKKEMAKRILESVKDIKKPKIAVLGLAFKGGTDDCRESPSIEIIEELLKDGAHDIIAYDPKAADNAKLILGDRISYAKNEYDVFKNADVLVIATEWSEFKDYDLSKIKELMRHHQILDFRNILDGNKAEKVGFKYRGIGR
ncbi:MAG: UDP-glucose/GDP-mannose dehydrogenase family protein [Campylobacteraceae bacterium]|jgi:UDPglucose 6-dehydrogenase|nr:UDP-glucose/GDP-mannose dehydrogenase family protein [Campylobacteraceae bacterium]